MSSFFDSGPLPDWKDIQKWLGKDMPWDQLKKWDQEGDSDWLSQYVKEMMRKPRTEARVHSQSMLQMEAWKDAKHVNVTIRIAPGTDLRSLQLFATSDCLRVTGLPDHKKRAIRFPCLVYPRTGKAVMKKDQISIRFRRKPPEKSEHELFIRT
ncbi:hypothetical protein [Cohnella sp.]|uniref:hypothetical protein n=1 Tax=Cohnella sp. TaxID=1883426 RepID=UPI0035683C84